MRVSSISALTALALLFVKGIESNHVTVRITNGQNISAYVGDDVTLTCEVVGNQNLSGSEIRWEHGTELIEESSCTYNYSFTPCTCNHTISDADLSSNGLYTCKINVRGTLRSSRANLTIFQMTPMVCVSDPSTGAHLDDPEYGPVVVPSGTTRLFKCFVQDAQPGIFNLTWTIGKRTEMGMTVAESPTGEGLVNVSSFLLLKHPGDETQESNLTCTATNIHNGKYWNSTSIRITFCRGSGYKNTVIGVLISLCVAATIAAVIAEVLIYKHYNG